MPVINGFVRWLLFAAALFVACADPGGGSGGAGGGAGEAAMSGDAGVPESGAGGAGSPGAAGGAQQAGAPQGGEATAGHGGATSGAGQSGHGGEAALAGEPGAAGLAGDAGARGDAGAGGGVGTGGDGGYDGGEAGVGGAPGSAGSDAGTAGGSGEAGSDACGGEQVLVGPPLHFVESATPHSVLADLNGDDHSDLVLLTRREVSVRLGDGHGSFEPATLYAVGVPTRVAAADLDADGHIDLAVANEGGSVSILLGFGDGTFANAINYPIPLQPNDLAAGDWNEDGSVDLAFTHHGSDSASIALNRGDGSFLAAESFVAGPTPRRIAAADFNGDGSLDLAFGLSGSLGLPQYGDLVRILENDGTGHFTEGPSFVPGELATALLSTDLNDDGDADILVADGFDTPMFYVVLSDGEGGFELPEAYTARVGPASFASGDLDDDGDNDILSLSGRILPDRCCIEREPRSTTLSVFLNDGEGRLSLAADYSAGPESGDVAAGDLNADGIPDVIVTSAIAATLRVMISRGNGFLVAGRSYRTAPAAPFDGAAADLDGDGDLDLAIAMRPGGVSVSFNDGTGVFGEPSGYATSEFATNVIPADFNDDGHPDLVFGSDMDSGILLNLGDGTFGEAIEFTDGYAWALAAGDLDDDGSVDVLTGENGITVRYGRGDATFEAPVHHALASGPISLAMAELDGDGLLDLVAVGNNVIHVLTNLGSRSFAPTSYPVGSGPQRMAIGDFDGENGVDIVAHNNVGSTLSVLLNRGDGTFEVTAEQPAVLEDFFVVAGDFTGDGHVDLMTSGNRYQMITLFVNDGHANFTASQRFGAGVLPSGFVPGDLDGNGTLDLAIPNNSGADFTVLLSECAE
jgi:hypothetical protein